MKWADFATSDSALKIVIGWILGIGTVYLTQKMRIMLDRQEEQRKKKEEREEKESANKLNEREQKIFDWCKANPSQVYIVRFFNGVAYLANNYTALNEYKAPDNEIYKLKQDLLEMERKRYIEFIDNHRNTGDCDVWHFHLLE